MGEDVVSRKPVCCPRCGYDQRGELARWETSCTLEGVCAECGLQIRWAELLCPEKFTPVWSVEYATGRLGALRGAGRTMVRSLRPHRFWSAMRMTHPVRGRRLAAYVVILCLLPILCGVVEQSVTAVRVRYLIAQVPGVTAVGFTYREAVLDAVTRPLARRSQGVLIGAGGATGMYPPPATLHSTLASMPRRWVGMMRGPDLRGFLIVPAVAWTYAIAIHVLLPVSLVVLPVSRRRAKVRWSHVWRVAIYSLVIPSLVASLVFAALLVAALVPSTYLPVVEWTRRAVVLLPIPVLVVWWAIAIRHYLRLPHGFAVAIVLTILSALIALLAVAVIGLLT